MQFNLNAIRRGALLAACLFCTQANASVVISSTRVVFDGDEPEVTVKLSNEGPYPSLVQAWIDDGNPQASMDDLQVPFSLMPGVFRLDGGKGQSLRLFHSGEAMAQAHESLFWLNVLDIPPKGSGNRLQLSLRSRIKLFYRPTGLEGKAVDAHQKLTWRMVRDGGQWRLQADNASPYFVNLAQLEVKQAGETLLAKPSHVPPFSHARFSLENVQPNVPAQVRYAFIDDYGAVRDGSQPTHLVWGN